MVAAETPPLAAHAIAPSKRGRSRKPPTAPSSALAPAAAAAPAPKSAPPPPADAVAAAPIPVPEPSQPASPAAANPLSAPAAAASRGPVTLTGTWKGVTHTIQWVDSYRYLGFWIFYDLRVWGKREGGKKNGRLIGGMGFLDEVSRRANLAYARTVGAHTLIRNAPPALSLQIFRTAVSGCVNYLMSLTEPTEDACKPLNRLSLKVARSALRLKSNCPASLAWAESRLLPCEAVMARERSRFLLSLQLSPLKSIGQDIYTALLPFYKPAPKDKKRSNPHAMWTHRMLDLQAHYAEAGAAPAVVTSCLRPRPFDLQPSQMEHTSCGCLSNGVAEPPHATTTLVGGRLCVFHDARTPVPISPGWESQRYHLYVDIKRAANVHGRGVGLAAWKSECISRDAGNPDVSPSITSADRPRAGPPSAHTADLMLMRSGTPVCLNYTGARKTITALSALGPNCSGAVRALVNRQIPSDVMMALGMVRQGREAMFLYPLAPPSRLCPPRPHTNTQNQQQTRSENEQPAVSLPPSPSASPHTRRRNKPSLALQEDDAAGGEDSASGSDSDDDPYGANVFHSDDPEYVPGGSDDDDDDEGERGKSQPKKRKVPARGADTPEDTPPPDSKEAAEAAAALAKWQHDSHDTSAACSLCATGPEDPFHVLCECTHPAVASCRADILAKVPSKLLRICELALDATSCPGMTRFQIEAVKRRNAGRMDRLRAALEDHPEDWTAPERHFLLYRFLLGLPFGAAAAAPDHELVEIVGNIFDNVSAKAHKLRPMANAWTSFGSAAVLALFRCWNSEFTARARAQAKPAVAPAQGQAAAQEQAPPSASAPPSLYATSSAIISTPNAAGALLSRHSS